MSMIDPFNNLGSIWYHSEPLEVQGHNVEKGVPEFTLSVEFE